MPFLADTTIWVWARAHGELREKLAKRVADGDVWTCAPVVLELLHGARDGDEYEEELAGTVGPLDWLPLTADAGHGAFAMQRGLAHTTHGAHRITAIDYLIVGIAEQAGSDVVVWHADRDLGRICDFTGQPHEHERLPRRRR